MIKTVTEEGTIVNNSYNAEGYRTGKEVNGKKTYYLYEVDKIILEVDEAGNQKARNVYGTNLILRTADGETYYYLYNGHADVTALVTREGTIAATYYYDAFENILESTGEVNNNIRYSGYQYEEETGLYYVNARMYDPKTARFLQEDTYTGDPNDPLSLNLYTYCSNNPIIYLDPTGHSQEDATNALAAGLTVYGLGKGVQAVKPKISVPKTIQPIVNANGTMQLAAASAPSISVAVEGGLLRNLAYSVVGNQGGSSYNGSNKVGTKKVDDIIDGATDTTRNVGKARNLEKSGGYEQAVKDFSSLNPSDTKNISTKYGDGMYGTLSDGTTISVRPGSETGGSTLEIKVPGQELLKSDTN